MSAAVLLERVRTAGGSLRVTDGKVIARHIPINLIPALKSHKDELVALLTAPANDDTVTRPVIQFLLADSAGGSMLGEMGDDVGDLVNGLIDRYGVRLIAVKHQDRIIWPAPD